LLHIFGVDDPFIKELTEYYNNQLEKIMPPSKATYSRPYEPSSDSSDTPIGSRLGSILTDGKKNDRTLALSTIIIIAVTIIFGINTISQFER
jgi:hypothetical protein